MINQSELLKRFGIAERDIWVVVHAMTGRGIDYADMYFEASVSDEMVIENGYSRATVHVDRGVGIRAISGDKSGYAFSNEITLPTMLLAAETVGHIRNSARDQVRIPIVAHPQEDAPSDFVDDPTQAPSASDRVRLLESLRDTALRFDRRVKSTIVTLSRKQKEILVASTDNILAGDRRELCRVSVTCIAEHMTRREIGTAGGGGHIPLAAFLASRRVEHYAKEAARLAVMRLNAVEAPVGIMDVVLAPGWQGAVLHDGIGHGLEADFNRKGVSHFADRIGYRVASKTCTVVDDGTLAFERGSSAIDDEGTPTRQTVLIEQGILRRYLTDRLNAGAMKTGLTGNGRRQDFRFPPQPAMTNTFLAAGEEDPEDIIRSVPRGLYVAQVGGAQVDISTGKFVFSAVEAYLIEGGRLTRPVKGATLVGTGHHVFTRISMVGNDLRMAEGVGTCGKDGQSLAIGVGLPTVKVEGLAVGKL